MNKEYLGDSVYASFDGFHVVLTTENDITPSNTIALEPAVLAALDRYRNALKPAFEEITLPNSMGDAIKRALQITIEHAQFAKDIYTKGATALATVAAELSPGVEVNAYGGSFWLTVSKREDVQVLMKLAPMWKKSPSGTGIDYDAEVNGVDFKIRTTDGALPPTCKLVERDVEIPAEPAKPARIEKRMVVECAKVAV